MLVSKDWLAEYVEMDMPHDDLVDRLTMSGLNHEGTAAVGNDQQIDLEVTSNRSDCLGHIGVAREIAVLYQKDLSLCDPKPAVSDELLNEQFSVAIECPELCQRFTARLIRGVKIAASPEWLVDRLATANIQSVNNVVDISNYVMLECGQPLHTFDYDKLQGQQIIVREPRQAEKLIAIDHNTYDLEAGMCVIADSRRAIGLGGVMGGADTEVSESTTNILVEAALFNPLAIRFAARRLNLHSAASFRFERSIDSNQIDWASRRCCQLMLELCGGQLADGMIDVGNPPQQRSPLRLRYSQLDRILGIDIPRQRIPQILRRLGFEIQDSSDSQITVIPPTFRLDVTREVDLIEEVGRIYGYDKVPEDVSVPMSASVRSHTERVFDKLRRCMTSAGFDEAVTASLVPEKWSEAFSPWSDTKPLASSQPMLGVLEKASQNIGQVNLLRRSLVPSLLEVFRINEYKQNQDVNLFEIARLYLPQSSGLPQEPWKLTLVSDREYYSVKGAIESSLGMLNPACLLNARSCDWEILDITRSAELWIEGRLLGWLGELSEAGKQLFRIKRDATIAELDVALLMELAVKTALHSEISQFPAITRDFNFVVDESVRWSDLEKTVRAASAELLETVTYKETFRNAEKDGPGKKRLLLSVVLRSLDSTLTGPQAEDVCQKIVAACGKQHSATLLG